MRAANREIESGRTVKIEKAEKPRGRAAEVPAVERALAEEALGASADGKESISPTMFARISLVRGQNCEMALIFELLSGIVGSDVTSDLTPYLDAFEHKVRRRWAPVYLRGLLLPGERKSIEPIVNRVAPDEKEQIHHFVATSKWDTAPIEARVDRPRADPVSNDEVFAVGDA